MKHRPDGAFDVIDCFDAPSTDRVTAVSEEFAEQRFGSVADEAP